MITRPDTMSDEKFAQISTADLFDIGNFDALITPSSSSSAARESAQGRRGHNFRKAREVGA